MSTNEHGPSSSPYHTYSSSVGLDGMRLAKKRESLAATATSDTEELEDAPLVVDALNGPIDFADEPSPFFDQLVDEQATNESNEVADSSVETSAVEVSTSRIAEMLRRSANGVDTANEKWGDTKRTARKKLGLIGRAAARLSIATGEFAAGLGSAAAAKGLEVADRADAALFNTVDSAIESVKATTTAAADRTGDAIISSLAKVESGMDVAGDKLIAFKDGAKDKLIARKQRAVARKQARRERWSQRWTTAKEVTNTTLDKSAELAMAGGRKLEGGMDYVGDKILSAQDKAKDTAERTRRSVAATRSLGRLAIDNRRA